MDVIDVTLVLDTNILASGDVMAIPQEVLGAFNGRGIARKLVSITATDGDDQATAFDLVFFNASATLGTLNAGVTISDADAAKIIGYVQILATDGRDLINSTQFVKSGIEQVMKPAYASASLWIGAICRSGTPTYTASGIKLKLGFED